MKIPYQSKSIEVNEVEPVTSDEKWNIYKLPNEKLLCIKTNLISVFEATEEKTPEGETVYIVKTNTIIKVK